MRCTYWKLLDCKGTKCDGRCEITSVSEKMYKFSGVLGACVTILVASELPVESCKRNVAH